MFPPVEADVTTLDEVLAPYRGPKGNLRFPLDGPIPYDLIERIVRLRVERDSDSGPGGRPKRLGRRGKLGTI